MAGLLDIFGTGGGEALGLLGGDVSQSRNDAQAQALYALAGSLLSGGPTGQSIVRGLQQGSQAYRGSMKNDLEDRMGVYQLQELKRKQAEEQAAKARQQRIDQAVAGAYQPAQAAVPGQMVEEDGRYMGENPGTEGRAAGFNLQSLAPALMGSPEGRKTLSELMTAQKAMQGETFSLAEGATQYQRDPMTGQVRQVAQGSPKKEATPAEIQGFQLAQSQGFKGSFLDYELAKKKAGATNVNVTSGDKAFSSAFGTGVAKQVEQGFNAAQSANSTLARIGEIKPLLSGDQVYSGPLATSQVAATRIADKLGITGNTTAEKLANTSKAMQQLAGLEMDAAQALSGQGAITENERALIKRAAGGDLMTMTAPEVNALLSGLEKTSKYKIKVHETNLNRLGKNKELAPLAEYYKIDAVPQNAFPVQSPTAMPAGFRVVR